MMAGLEVEQIIRGQGWRKNSSYDGRVGGGIDYMVAGLEEGQALPLLLPPFVKKQTSH
jgi:hypothetical protein